ncbi:hypothetical protein PsorP6_004281 [Peronosclerospora sorghi]|uniref:Uncharacterized protein n=1 Tax=Peronosclerospora sorghi TaxID=230839 RepID=A0ACC0VS37_9STRA|nr:hypothetical protein PsorP6_004281 [Peronosclerospora sorghi]
MTSINKSDKRALYVGGLDKQVTEEVLYSAFIPFGPVKAVQIATDYSTQRSKCFGFVEFEDEVDAKAAIDNMDGFYGCYTPLCTLESELFGRTLRVCIAKPDRPKLGSNKPVWAEADELCAQEEPTQERGAQ